MPDYTVNYSFTTHHAASIPADTREQAELRFWEWMRDARKRGLVTVHGVNVTQISKAGM